MASTPFRQPPNHLPIEPNSKSGITVQWKQWFNDIYRFLSAANHQTITAAREVNLDADYVDISVASGTYAITLAAPSIPGRVKIIEATDVSGTSITMALTNVVGGSNTTTCTWNSTGDTLVLLSLSNKWLVIKEYGVTLT